MLATFSSHLSKGPVSPKRFEVQQPDGFQIYAQQQQNQSALNLPLAWFRQHTPK